MELAIEEALQQGITAHKEGKIQEAERLYRAIIQSQPAHPDANHNLGILAVSLNKAELALPLFKIALEANPKIEQFWLSYIDALIKEKQFETAKQIIQQAKQQEIDGEKINALKAQLVPISETESANSSNLTQQQLNSLLGHYQSRRYGEAEKLAVSLTQKFPEHSFGWKVLGAVLAQTGRKSEAVYANQKAIALSPEDAEAHNSLGITLQALGRLEEAEASYTQAIAMKPDYSEVYNNLGNTLRQLGRLEEAEASYTQAIAMKPDYSEAHNNLGNTLQKLRKLDEAEASLRQAITLKPDYAEAHNNLGNTLQKLRKLDEAEASLRQAITLKPDYAGAHSNLGTLLQELGRFDEAEVSYTQAIALKSDFVEAHNNLGVTLQELGRLDEAEASFRQAITLKPDYAKAHNNLGNTLKELGRLDEAEASYTQAIALKPDFAEAYYNLGGMLQELERLDEAEASYTQAIALKPDYAEAYSNLGITLQELGRLEEAVASFNQAIALKPDFANAYMNLSLAIENLKFSSSNRSLYKSFSQLLTVGNFTNPKNVAGSILSLLKHDPLIKDLLLKKDVAVRFEEVTSIIGSLDKLKLLHHLMRICQIPDLQFEEFFVTVRRLLLTNLDKIEVSPELIYFLSTLSLHCFTNEYVYFENDEEILLVKELEDKITQTVMQSEQPEAINILCLASYRPLHQYDWCQKLEALDHLEEVKSRLIEEPHSERVIAVDIPILGEISDNVSRKVREQYEENPYPRWVKLGIQLKPKSISEVCDDLNLHLHSKSIKNVTAPAILIAGCGTGQHSIGTGSRFSGCQVIAVDLSLASLAYAQRMTNDLGLRNLKYLQADILKLDQLEQEFDIIESSGVLHHMDEPMVGWRVLTDLLKPGGLMRIGLYSELARSQIVKARREIASLGIGTSATEIRNFRESLRVSESKDSKGLTTFVDFFSLSEFRDLIFHVQEHRFTLLQINSCLNELGLKFCGFEDKDICSRFKEFHGDEVDICDLVLWHEFEESNPRTFGGMYQFWCQKL